MTYRMRCFRGIFQCCLLLSMLGIASADDKDIPDALKPWKSWVTWDDKERDCPTLFNSAEQRVCFWPSRLSLVVDQSQATWAISVNAFDPVWAPLPGSSETWPQKVLVDGKPAPVLEREGKPYVRVAQGAHQVAGVFEWREMPQRITLPKEVGILSLSVNGKAVDFPNWDADGAVWLKRQLAAAAEKDVLIPRVYRVIEDGVPIWLRTRIELTVSGKSREESLGWILPQGWRLSYVESPIPVAVDEQGRVKAQVRAGKWTIAIDAFRTMDLDEFRYPPDAKPMTDVELIGWKAQPLLRSAELTGLQAVDVTQTTFPNEWRDLPVYEWKTNTTFKLVEKLRGMGQMRPPGLTIQRRMWLDDDGRGLTYRDSLSGQMQQIWRLDAADGEELGAVRIDGAGQLVTADPKTGAPGVEIRNRNLNMEAIGRTARVRDLSATGWNTDADSLHLTLMLPPGWRVFTIWGADQVTGDWLTAWTLLDLFLVLIFSLAALRLWGIRVGIVALLALAISYHELGAPRYTWLFLLMPLALLKAVPEGAGRRYIVAWKVFAQGLLALCLVPFLAQQIQTAIYPQLESQGTPYRQRTFFPLASADFSAAVNQVGRLSEGYESKSSRMMANAAGENLQFDSTAKIQTGPAEPAWTWNQVECDWNGPVAANQQIQPVLISLFWRRVLTLIRIALLLTLVSMLFSTPGKRRLGLRSVLGLFSRRVTPAGCLLLFLFLPVTANGQVAEKISGPIPDQQMLETLRTRLLQPSDVFPHAAEIADAELQLHGARIKLETEIHTALDVAVPLPGRLPTWSPLSVKIDGAGGDMFVCRLDGYLWAICPKGVHKVVVEGLLADVGEWEWTFLLKPRRVAIDAPDWTVTGVNPDGGPEQQVFFARKQQATESQAAYDRKDFNAIVAVQRQIEAGLVWKVHNTVTRLSPAGKAISLKLPLLEGESVLTSNLVGQSGQIEVRLGASDTSFQWDSDLSITPTIHFTARNNEQWVERWQLVASPVWDVTLAGSAPFFDAQEQRLIPTWQPWSGEEVTLKFARPQAVSGDTVTVQQVTHEIMLGDRQRSATLKLDLECSLASDFAIAINPNAEVTSLTLDDKSLPVRREGANLILPAHPGHQTAQAAWRIPAPMDTVATADQISLPVDAANITTIMTVPDSRWVLWAHGPQRGPAVRFWAVLAVAIVAALALGSVALSPLRRIEWVLLAIGLTQVNVVAALVVVVWLFALAWRGKQNPALMSSLRFNYLQTGLVLLTVASLGILSLVASKGLLGQPEMFIIGNGSTRTSLRWFQPRAGVTLPDPYIVSVSVWYYRYAMLAWALWLALALLRWLTWGWKQFTHGGVAASFVDKSPSKPVMAEVIS